VSWGIQLFRDHDPTPFEATLENISSGGVAFVSTRAFADGEHLQGQVLLPAETRPWGNGAVILECKLRVIRSERDTLPGYLVRCEIKTYRIRPLHAQVHEDCAQYVDEGQNA
jgi:hypothetical protein